MDGPPQHDGDGRRHDGDGTGSDGVRDTLLELGGVLLTEASLQAVLDLVVKLVHRSFEDLEGVGATLIGREGLTTASYSDERVIEIDRLQYDASEGPCLSALADGRVYHCSDTASEKRWPGFIPAALRAGLASVLAVPLVPRDVPLGVLNIYAERPNAFGAEELDAATAIAEQASVVLANAVAYETVEQVNGQLTEALVTRDLIGQAKGVIMVREGCGPDEAFERLRELSQRRNVKLRAVAQGIVDSVQGGPRSAT